MWTELHVRHAAQRVCKQTASTHLYKEKAEGLVVVVGTSRGSRHCGLRQFMDLHAVDLLVGSIYVFHAVHNATTIYTDLFFLLYTSIHPSPAAVLYMHAWCFSGLLQAASFSFSLQQAQGSKASQLNNGSIPNSTMNAWFGADAETDDGIDRNSGRTDRIASASSCKKGYCSACVDVYIHPQGRLTTDRELSHQRCLWIDPHVPAQELLGDWLCCCCCCCC